MSGSYELQGQSKSSLAPAPNFTNGHQVPQNNPHVQPPMPAPAPAPAPMLSNNFMTSSTVVVNQPGADDSKNRLVLVKKSQLQSRSWNSGICGCCNDLTGCVFGTFCFPCLLVRLSNRLNECALVTCCVPGAFVTLRTQLRIMGGIEGSICKDCIETCCCPPCVACQMSREMSDMGL